MADRETLEQSLDELASDRSAGATALTLRALGILDRARRDGRLLWAARRVCAGQAAMASLWNAALCALAAEREPHRLERFTRALQHAPRALARFGVGALLPVRSEPLHVLTVSASGSVRAVLDAAHAIGPLRVSCTESRPGLEGRALAGSLAAAGLAVTIYADAAAAHALDDADAMLVGADAVGPAAFVNRSGTRMLAAAAARAGVPVYVIASRDKFVMPALWPRLHVREEPPAEVWADPPAGVRVSHRLFEATPLDLVTAVITDAGVIGADLAAQVCDSLRDEGMETALAELLGPEQRS